MHRRAHQTTRLESQASCFELCLPRSAHRTLLPQTPAGGGGGTRSLYPTSLYAAPADTEKDELRSKLQAAEAQLEATRAEKEIVKEVVKEVFVETPVEVIKEVEKLVEVPCLRDLSTQSPRPSTQTWTILESGSACLCTYSTSTTVTAATTGSRNHVWRRRVRDNGLTRVILGNIAGGSACGKDRGEGGGS